MNWSLKAGAAEFGLARETLKARLIAAGLYDQERSGEQTWTTIELHRALSRSDSLDLRMLMAETRKAEADATMRENELAQQEGRLGDVATFQRLLDAQGAAVRARILGWPDTAGPKLNPSDPMYAVDGLRAEVDSLLPLLQCDVRAAMMTQIGEATDKAEKKAKTQRKKGKVTDAG